MDVGYKLLANILAERLRKWLERGEKNRGKPSGI